MNTAISLEQIILNLNETPEQTLQRCEADVKEEYRNALRAAMIGRRLERIKRQELFRLRGFASFEAYVESEHYSFKSETQANRYIQVAWMPVEALEDVPASLTQLLIVNRLV